jgi:coproporphyrinogen III oxidase-like Fe-S oxidoreductase
MDLHLNCQQMCVRAGYDHSEISHYLVPSLISIPEQTGARNRNGYVYSNLR